MGILLALVLGLLALAFVLQPLYKRTSKIQDVPSSVVRRGASLPPPFPADQPASLRQTGQTEREQAARAALHEVELDYQLGNITETDYRMLRERYMRRALRELKSRYDREQELDEVIEEQLRRLKEENEQTTQ